MPNATVLSVSSETEGRPGIVDSSIYDRLYAWSVEDPESFWMEQGRRLDWIKPYSCARNVSYGPSEVRIRWYEDGILNASVNCVDRHLSKYAERAAIIWVGDSPAEHQRISYIELHENVCRLANALRACGIKRGDRVAIYLPMVPEAAYAMLACARLGAVHSVVFGGFSPESLANRITDSGATLLITADEGLRGGRKVPLKRNADEALKLCPNITRVIVVRRTGGEIPWADGRDRWYDELCRGQAVACTPEQMSAEDPLFILYTSGSTGKPKGVLHTTGGYLTFISMTHQYVFDYREGDIYWCTADVGWVTGHSYIIYGPLANGATTLMFEGVPNYPDPSRYWQIIDEYNVNIFYTAPTAIRALIREGESWVRRTTRKSLRVLGSVGEPINPEAWLWYYNVVGEGRCPVIDTWWQTETGGIVIAPLPGAMTLKPGSATRPFFGIVPQIVDDTGAPIEGPGERNLCLLEGGPAMLRTLYGDHQRFIDTYFKTFPGKYFTGDGARRDEDGYYWITGRVDDVINVAGHRLGTAEIESALGSHPKVAEAAVVGYEHPIKGQGIYAFVTLKVDEQPSEALRRQLVACVRKDIGPIALPDIIHWAPHLPKTRSGKIMRRLLRKIAAREFEALGDTTTLADSTVIDELVAARRALASDETKA
jgi:acetyl-CoA synthetase